MNRQSKKAYAESYFTDLLLDTDICHTDEDDKVREWWRQLSDSEQDLVTSLIAERWSDDDYTEYYGYVVRDEVMQADECLTAIVDTALRFVFSYKAPDKPELTTEAADAIVDRYSENLGLKCSQVRQIVIATKKALE